MQRHPKGSIVILVVLMLSLLGVATMQFVQRASVHTHFDRVMRLREQAKVLAFNGISLAISQLTVPKESIKLPPTPVPGQPPLEQLMKKKMLEKILPHLNIWQHFTLDEARDGMAGEIKMCLMSEDGKININEAFDFKAGVFKKEFAPWLSALQLGGRREERGQFIKSLEEFLKKRGHKLNDLSELLALEHVAGLPLYYEPPKETLKKEAPEGFAIALTDIFTVASKKPTIEPWLFSNACCHLFGLRPRESKDSSARKDNFAKALERFDVGLGKNWLEHFPVLMHLYERRPAGLERLVAILSKEFDPTVFTVLSSGTAGSAGSTVEVRLLAVLEKHGETYRVAKLYWL